MPELTIFGIAAAVGLGVFVGNTLAMIVGAKINERAWKRHNEMKARTDG